MLYVLTTIYTLIAVSGAAANLHRWPASATPVVLNVLAIANIPRAAFHDRPRQAFASSCAAIATLVGLFGLALRPNLVAARNDPVRSLTIYRAASSHLTLVVMLVIAGIGAPLVLTYTAIVYWTFRRRVTVDGHGY